MISAEGGGNARQSAVRFWDETGETATDAADSAVEERARIDILAGALR